MITISTHLLAVVLDGELHQMTVVNFPVNHHTDCKWEDLQSADTTDHHYHHNHYFAAGKMDPRLAEMT